MCNETQSNSYSVQACRKKGVSCTVQQLHKHIVSNFLQQPVLKNMIFYVITSSSSLSLLFFQNKYGVKKRPPPPANCISLWGSCKSQGTVCCDYCAFCQCRLFRTVCYCRMGNPRCWIATGSLTQFQAKRTNVYAPANHLQWTPWEVNHSSPLVYNFP